MKNVKLQTTIRINTNVWRKFKLIAKNNKRSINSELEYVIENIVNQYYKSSKNKSEVYFDKNIKS